jgi:hypothetical protein
MATTPFPTSPQLTAIVIGYRNAQYIADSVLPYVPVLSESFDYTVYAVDELIRIVDDTAGRTGELNTVQAQGSKVSATCLDRGLKEPVPQRDIQAAENNPGVDPLARATTRVAEYIAVNRERRVANLVGSGANYAGNTLALSGTSKWSDYGNSDPIDAILTGLDACLMRPNKLVMGQNVFTKVRQHPKVAKAVLGNAGDKTAATRAQLAEVLEVEEVLVGTARGNVARPGQAADLQRLWGNICAGFYSNPVADTSGGMSFGFTARWGARLAGSNRINPGDMGLRGGAEVYAGESTVELITAPLAGYLWTGCI